METISTAGHGRRSVYLMKCGCPVQQVGFDMLNGRLETWRMIHRVKLGKKVVGIATSEQQIGVIILTVMPNMSVAFVPFYVDVSVENCNARNAFFVLLAPDVSYLQRPINFPQSQHKTQHSFLCNNSKRMSHISSCKQMCEVMCSANEKKRKVFKLRCQFLADILGVAVWWTSMGVPLRSLAFNHSP